MNGNPGNNVEERRKAAMRELCSRFTEAITLPSLWLSLLFIPLKELAQVMQKGVITYVKRNDIYKDDHSRGNNGLSYISVLERLAYWIFLFIRASSRLEAWEIYCL